MSTAFVGHLGVGDPQTKSSIRLTNPAPATGFRVSAASASGIESTDEVGIFLPIFSIDQLH
ncbi:hypothetical protein FH972_005083 [Carpinus fangiana]|uniref:Uncharacterized protein n=1 Tax=Carpinus fangiana TaxID=176857 RepID=A0A5N6QNW9_9ROSI|nr:hypothetical protein FH972_005083 [Carpinus fangiana]